MKDAIDILRRGSVTEVPSCSFDANWVWTPGHIERKRFIGTLLSMGSAPMSGETLDPRQVVRLTVHHGWVHYIDVGVGEWCDADWVMLFRDTVAPDPDKPRPTHITPATWVDITEAVW